MRVQIRISNSLVAAKRVPRRGRRPDVASNSALGKRRGRRECRVMASPMARLQQKKQAAVTTGGAGQPAFPARWFTAYIAISPGTGLSCPRRLRDDLANLSLSVGRPGPRDFTVRVSHVRPTCPPRPSHPRPTYRDDRPKRPSSSRRDAREHGFDLPDGASADACGGLARRAVCAWHACGVAHLRYLSGRLIGFAAATYGQISCLVLNLSVELPRLVCRASSYGKIQAVCYSCILKYIIPQDDFTHGGQNERRCRRAFEAN